MKSRCSLWVAGAVLCGLVAGPAHAEIEHIVVLPFTVAKGVDEKTGVLLDEVVLTELDEVAPASTKVVGSSDVAALLGFEQQKQLVACDDTSCLVEIGHALGASHLLVPSVGQLGSRYLVSAKFLDVRGGTVQFRKVFYVDGNEDALLAGVRQISEALAASQGWKRPAGSTGATPVAMAGSDQTPTNAAATTDPEGEDQTMLWAGVGVAGTGLALAAGLGIGAVAYDSAVVGDASLDGAARQDAAGVAMALGVGSAVGAAALIAGGVVAGLAVLE